MDSYSVFKELKEGDFVLFNDRKQPLKVVETRNDSVFVEGPGGGSYVLHTDNKVVLVSNKGNRRYSSKVEGLRRTGNWEKRDEGFWKHTGTGAEIKVYRMETGLWKLEIKGFEPSRDIPQYGYTEREMAVEEAEKVMRKHSEGD